MSDVSLSLEGRPTERLSQLRAIYDCAPVGLCFLDRDLRYVNLNQRLADMNGSSVQEMLGRKVAEIVPKMYAQAEANLKRALQGEAHSGVLLYGPPAQPGGPATERLASYQPVRDEDGEVLGVCVSILDNSAFEREEKVVYEIAGHNRPRPPSMALAAATARGRLHLYASSPSRTPTAEFRRRHQLSAGYIANYKRSA